MTNLVILLALALDGHALVVVSESEAFTGTPVGIEVMIDTRYLRLEAGAHGVEKLDGGDGTILSGTALYEAPRGFYGGLKVASMSVERYDRTDYWLVLGWRFLRLELERETSYLEFRPEFDHGRFRFRPALGYINGRGADGLAASLAVGVTW